MKHILKFYKSVNGELKNTSTRYELQARNTYKFKSRRAAKFSFRYTQNWSTKVEANQYLKSPRLFVVAVAVVIAEFMFHLSICYSGLTTRKLAGILRT